MKAQRQAIPLFMHAIIVTSVLIILFCIYGRLHFYRDPGSLFFDSERAFERNYGVQRVIEAIAFGNAAHLALNDRAETRQGFSWKTGPSPVLCGVFITIARQNETSTHPIEVCIFPITFWMTVLLTNLLAICHQCFGRFNGIGTTRLRCSTLFCQYKTHRSPILELMAP